MEKVKECKTSAQNNTSENLLNLELSEAVHLMYTSL